MDTEAGSPKTTKKKTIGFRPPRDVDEMLLTAEQATGSSITDLINECVRLKLDDVVRTILEERQKAASEYLRRRAPKNGKRHTGK